MLLAAPAFELPLVDPILKFLLILGIILCAPLLLNRLRIPHLLGLIIAGAVIGPYGLNLVMRDSSIILSGTAGLLYIMFLAGLEMDMSDFRRNGWRGGVFGLYTFLVPLGLGYLTGVYLLGFEPLTALLLGAMFSSHTLITYPIVSRLGIGKNKAVNIAVAGTILTDTLALVTLTVVAGLVEGGVDHLFWYRLGGSVAAFALVVIGLFPPLARWFFKRVDDALSHYIFVLVMVFLGAYLAQLAGLEAIIGAFLTGMVLSRLIPKTSPLMNRVEFVGNAIFIPFFLISVGMLIDYRSFFTEWKTVEVGAVMIVVATTGKYLAAWFTQRSFRLSADQRRLIFGLSNARVAATLATVMVGYNLVVGTAPDGEPIRLFNESILNGTILMILVTCTIASFSTQRAAHNLALAEVSENENEDREEHILIPVSNEATVAALVQLSTAIKSPRHKNALYALNVVDNRASDEKAVKQAHKVLHAAATAAAATDDYLHELLRYDLNTVNAIISVAKEQRITDLVMGLHGEEGITDSFLGRLTEGVLAQSDLTTVVYRPVQPLPTVKRHLIVIPPAAEREAGFPLWIARIWNLAHNTGGRILFYAAAEALELLRPMAQRRGIEADYRLFPEWNDFLILFREIDRDDALWIVLSRRERPSYHAAMSRIPGYLNRYAASNSYVLLFPVQAGGERPGRYLL